MKDVITDYIPQRPPMIMVDALVMTEESTATTSLKILPENIFVENDQFTEPGMMENIAQTAAALIGYQCKIANTPVPIGFIAAIKNWTLFKTPKINTTIETTIRVINQVMDVSIAEGIIKQAGELLCVCEMRILVQKNIGSNF